MKGSSLRWWCALGLVAAGIVVAGIALSRLASHVPEPTLVADQHKANPLSETLADAKDVLASNKQQPSAAAKSSKPAQVVNKANNKNDPYYYGSIPGVALDANPQVKSVVEAIKQKNHPERLSMLIAPKPFNAKAFAADPTTYLNSIEPGRVFQVAQPGPGVTRLRSSSPAYREIAQGDSTVLKVQAPPKSPVTFTSLDLGQFDNQLSSITVQADEKGFAEAKFTATPGVVENIHILAGSPVASGQARFTVYVQWPQSVAKGN